MKKITEETLNAIQENVRTRETQELDYKRDNLFKGSWKDFEIKDLKPNLIPDGWDSFSPYGSGKNYLAHSETFEDWDQLNGTEATFEQNVYFKDLDIHKATRIRTKKGRSQGQLKAIVAIQDREALNYSIFIKNLSTNRMFFRVFNPLSFHSIDAGEFVELKGSAEVLESLEFGGDFDLDFIAWRPIVFKGDDEPLTVIKTPLGNGLTRIQTWGGNDNIKLRNYTPINPEKIGSTSFYVENEGNHFVFQIDGANAFTITKDFKGLFYKQLTKGKGSDRNAVFRVSQINYNLDFIASDPQIVEGDKANPVLIVDELDDGREHVQVYGTTKDTKLVYSGNEGFIGEDYGLKTTIENNGIDLDLSTSLTEEKKRITKGENKVNLQGELSTKLSIEIGVPSE